MAVQPYSNLASAYPNLSGATVQNSNNILKQLRGELSPETQNAIQDASARFGITSGMPGSGLVMNRTVRDLGRSSQDVQQQGTQNLLNTIQGYSGTIAPSAGQIQQDNQFNADLGFRKTQADRQFGLDREAMDYKAMEIMKKYGPKEYSYTTTNYGGGLNFTGNANQPTVHYKYFE